MPKKETKNLLSKEVIDEFLFLLKDPKLNLITKERIFNSSFYIKEIDRRKGIEKEVRYNNICLSDNDRDEGICGRYNSTKVINLKERSKKPKDLNIKGKKGNDDDDMMVNICGTFKPGGFDMFAYIQDVLRKSNQQNDDIDIVFLYYNFGDDSQNIPYNEKKELLELKDERIFGLMILKKGECGYKKKKCNMEDIINGNCIETIGNRKTLGEQWSINSICTTPFQKNSNSMTGKYLISLFLFALYKNHYNFGFLELARGFANMPGLCLYSSFGFKVFPLFDCENYNEINPNNLKMVCNIKETYKEIGRAHV